MVFSQEKSEAAFKRIISLGGDGVWEPEIVAVSLADTTVTDDDLELFKDLDFIQILSLSNTQISDAGIVHLEQLSKLETLDLVNTFVTKEGIAKLCRALPNAKIETEPVPKDTVNPFTGKPFGK